MTLSKNGYKKDSNRYVLNGGNIYALLSTCRNGLLQVVKANEKTIAVLSKEKASNEEIRETVLYESTQTRIAVLQIVRHIERILGIKNKSNRRKRQNKR